MNYNELVANIKRKKSFLCVGLDPDLEKMPQHILETAEPIFEFNKAIIDATAPFAVAYKPNIAFYECHGLSGWSQLEKTVRYIREKYPDQFIIADAKRGDIGNTSRMYAKAFFENMDFDAITVSPYMGEDSVGPFLEYKGKWVIILALTSNKGSKDFQMIENVCDEKLYESVLTKSKEWGTTDNLMYVAGATQGSLLESVRKLVPGHFLLVPGVGAQGGSLAEVCRYGMNDNCGLLVNSSRGIIYASKDVDFAEASAKAASALAKEMASELEKKNIL